MRIRSIRPEFFDSESVGRLSREARLLFIGLWCMADDYGRMTSCLRLISARLFAFDGIQDESIQSWLSELVQGGMIQLYHVGNREFIQIINFEKYQKPNRKFPSTIPAPDGTIPATPPPMTPPARTVNVGRSFTPPTIEEVLLAAAKTGCPDNEAKAFWNHWESLGWRGIVEWQPRLTNWTAKWREKASLAKGNPTDGRNGDTATAPPGIRLKVLGERAAELADKIRLAPNAEERSSLIDERRKVVAQIECVRKAV